ncbi:hypothetical protein PG997_014119 [Apiospora hydei]|uniref:Uncharacterized protein n=1 Tax=Apiospora hydei TaxID=1337664 RepID=A0ABR1V8Z5_9PEZI
MVEIIPSFVSLRALLSHYRRPAVRRQHPEPEVAHVPRPQGQALLNGRSPHQFINTTPIVEFAAYCGDEANRKEYLIIKSGKKTSYMGSVNSNTNRGDHRVLYTY